MTHNSTSLNVKELHKNFGTEERPVNVLTGVSFKMEGGEALAVTGPSGSGKSTLLHLIGTLDSPTSGKIEINNQDISSFSETELAKFRNQKIGFMFQDHSWRGIRGSSSTEASGWMPRPSHTMPKCSEQCFINAR